MPITVAADPRCFPRRGALEPRRTALVVIDMQKDFCRAGGYYEAIGGDPGRLSAVVPTIAAVLAAARRAGLRIVHTRVGRRAEAWAGSDAPGADACGPMGRHLVRGEEGWQIVPELAPGEGEAVVDKGATGAFHGTDLDGLLRRWGVDGLVVCGVTTAICVSTSVREAHDRGYEVLVLGDACAEGDALSHAAALASFQLENGLLATVAPAAAFIAALGRLP